jgi:NitT/TauT family transport system ATP-binding protein
VLTAETLRTDVIELWVDGRLPMKSVLMVTHNIEEAVLMCDRILVFSSNPGRIASEIRVDFPHPRNRLDPAFRQMVDRIYAIMTQRPEPRPITADEPTTSGVGMVLNHVSTNEMAGLIEAVAAAPFGGRADLPVLADRLQMEADELFHLAEALQLLRFAVLTEGDLVLTEAGRDFADLDTDARKRLFARHLVDRVPIFGLIRRVLDERRSHTAPAARFRNELEDHMSEDYADETLETVVAWARYAELFAYDDQAEMFSLENPQ